MSTEWAFDIRRPGPTAFAFGSARPAQHHPSSEPSDGALRETSDDESDGVLNLSHHPKYPATLELHLPEYSRSVPTTTDPASSSLSRGLKRNELHETTFLDAQPYIHRWINDVPFGNAMDPVGPSSPKNDPVLATYSKESSVDPEELCRFSKRRRIMEPHPLRSSNDWIYVRYRKYGEGEDRPPPCGETGGCYERIRNPPGNRTPPRRPGPVCWDCWDLAGTRLNIRSSDSSSSDRVYLYLSSDN